MDRDQYYKKLFREAFELLMKFKDKDVMSDDDYRYAIDYSKGKAENDPLAMDIYMAIYKHFGERHNKAINTESSYGQNQTNRGRNAAP